MTSKDVLPSKKGAGPSSLPKSIPSVDGIKVSHLVAALCKLVYRCRLVKHSILLISTSSQFNLEQLIIMEIRLFITSLRLYTETCHLCKPV